MLDKNGIYLDEVNKRYPRTFQTLGYDVLMDTDNMYKPKVISTFEMVVNSILTLLLMKPGQYPSIPTLGIDIESYLYEYSDDKSIPMNIKAKLLDQCNRLGITNVDIYIAADKMNDGTMGLFIRITGDERLSYGLPSPRAIIGITYSQLNKLTVRKLFEERRNET